MVRRQKKIKLKTNKATNINSLLNRSVTEVLQQSNKSRILVDIKRFYRLFKLMCQIRIIDLVLYVC